MSALEGRLTRLEREQNPDAWCCTRAVYDDPEAPYGPHGAPREAEKVGDTCPHGRPWLTIRARYIDKEQEGIDGTS